MKKKNWCKKILCFALAAAMVAGLTACGGSKEDEEDGGKLTQATDDSVVDMGGYEFTIASPFLKDDPAEDEMTGAEAIFEEVRHQVEKDYNCTIKILPVSNDVETVRTKITAGEKIADIIDVESYNITPMARGGYIVPLETVKGLNLTDSRWLTGYTNLTEFNGQHYGTNFMRPAESRVCLVYNRSLLKECGITEDPQDLVADNKWTFDKFREMCKTMTRDTNGDGKNDTWGMVLTLAEKFGLYMMQANDARVVSMVDGRAKESYTDEKTMTALNFAYDLINVDKSVGCSQNGSIGHKTEEELMADFVKGFSGFVLCETWMINKNLKPQAGDMDYGILPLPMGPDATQYVSPSENARNFCITTTNKDVDKTVIILNALARYIENYDEDADWWTYDVKMDYFAEDDDKSVEIYKMLLDNATIDLGSGVSGLWSDFQETVVSDAILKNKGTPASKIQAIGGTYQGTIDAVYN